MKTSLLGWHDSASAIDKAPPRLTSRSLTDPSARLAPSALLPEQRALFSSAELPPRLWSLEEAAEFFGMSKAWVRDHATRREPRIPCIRLGGRRAVLRFRQDDLVAFVNRQAGVASDLFSKREKAGED